MKKFNYKKLIKQAEDYFKSEDMIATPEDIISYIVDIHQYETEDALTEKEIDFIVEKLEKILYTY